MPKDNPQACDIYQVQPYYTRFDQKNNMTRQGFWNPTVAELRRTQSESLRKRVKSQVPGYGLMDWAFYVGSRANMVNSGFSVNRPNQSGNSWQPILKTLPRRSGEREYESYGRLEVDPSVASRLIRKVSRLFGADQVGFCLLDRKWVYSHWFDEETKEHYPIRFSDEPGYEAYSDPTQLEDRTQVIPANMENVIVLIHEMDELGMATAPTLTQMATTFTAYSRISFTIVMLAEFIRGLGYHAIPSANDTALSIPLAIDAGLGELGRSAKLITRLYGPRCRISKVITDLPLEPGQPRLWGVTQFCNECRKCAKNCPANAIPMGDRSFEPRGAYSHRGVLQWQIDHLKCVEYLAKVGTYCGICIRSCPFNKSKHRYHNLVRWLVASGNPRIDHLVARMDDLLGYGKYKRPQDFWSA